MIKSVYSFNGFGTASMFKDITEADMNGAEKYVREIMPLLMDEYLKETTTIGNVQSSCFFGAFHSKPSDFSFLPNEKEAIFALSMRVKEIVDEEFVDSNIDHYRNQNIVDQSENDLCESIFGLVYGSTEKKAAYEIWNRCECVVSTSCTETKEPELKANSRTHTLLNKMLETANKNYLRRKPGYRFDNATKPLSTYVSLLGGPALYSTIHANFPLSIPSVSTTKLFARKIGTKMQESELRVMELYQYLTERNLPLIVSLSEDATRIDGRVQYDKRTNQLLGFVTHTDKSTGMPIVNSYPARNCQEIISHFATANAPAAYVNAIMAQPMAKFPPFCLLLYASDNKHTAKDVVYRWKFITEQLNKVNIKALSWSSDSDPRYNSAMRKRSLLGYQSEIFDKGAFSYDTITIVNDFFRKSSVLKNTI